MKEELKKEIGKILKEMGVENPKINFTIPTHFNLGDYSTNVAMIYAKQTESTPEYLAGHIKAKLEESNIFGVTVAKPAFLNFFFDKKYFGDNIKDILKNPGSFGKSEHAKGYRVMIEHTQPNPFKEFHIGHLMNSTIGESVARIVKANGAEVKTASYHGDVGLHVAKAVWAMLKKGSDFMDGYPIGHKAFEEDTNAKEEIMQINKDIYDGNSKQINVLYEDGRKDSLSYFESMYKKLDSHFDYHFYESESGVVGKKLVLKNIPKVFENGDEGAVIFRGENFEPKTHTRVFLNKDGLPTYEAKELGLAEIKKEKWKYDASVTITANEQDSFFKVVEVAIGEVFPELKGKLKHLSHGLLKLPSGKMSSREGNIISAENLIDQIGEKVLNKINDATIAHEITIGAIKYSILRQAIGGDIIFDIDKSISFEGDSGPYLQYSVVRAKSLVKKAEGVVSSSEYLPENWQTTNLERYLERFPSVVARSGMEYAPHHIATYLIELAGEFNSFYADHKIIDVEDKTSAYRLAITKAFVEVMTTGLDLLGIKVPDRM